MRMNDTELFQALAGTFVLIVIVVLTFGVLMALVASCAGEKRVPIVGTDIERAGEMSGDLLDTYNKVSVDVGLTSSPPPVFQYNAGSEYVSCGQEGGEYDGCYYNNALHIPELPKVAAIKHLDYHWLLFQNNGFWDKNHESPFWGDVVVSGDDINEYIE